MPTDGERFDRLYDQHFQEVLAYGLRRVPTTDGYAAANEVFAIAWRRLDAGTLGETGWGEHIWRAAVSIAVVAD